MTTRPKIQAIQSVKDYTQRKARRLYYGTLGNNAGTVDTTRNDWVFLRLHGDGNQVVEAYAAVSFPRVAEIIVDVEKVDRKGASYYQVLGVSAGITYASTDNPFPGLPGEHATTHQRRDRNTGGYDPLDVYNRALVNLRARAQTVPDLTCYVERGFYVITVFKEFAGGNSPAFTAPAGAFSTQRWDLLYLGNDDALHILQGTAAPINPVYPTVPANCIPIAYVILSNSSTTITELMITDARTILSSNQATATAHNLLSAVHTDTLTAAVVDGDVIIGNVTPAWSRLAISIPAANVRNVLGVDNGELRPSWKTALDATAPTTISVGAAASAGTSLVFSHRDHTHGAPATWTPATHDMITAHTYTGGANLDVFGLSGANTIARLTPSAAGAATAHLLCTDAAGGTRVTSLLVGLASALSDGQIWAAGEITSVNASGALAAKIAIYHNNATGNYKLSLVPANLTDNRTVTFANLTGIVALGAGTNTVSSTNDVTVASHTHAVTSSSNPGAAASLLATDASGNLQLAGLGIGTAAGTYILDVLSADETGIAFRRTQTTNALGLLNAFYGGSTGTTARGFLGFTHSGSGSDTIFIGEAANYMGLRGESGIHLGIGTAPIVTITSTVVTLAAIPAFAADDKYLVVDSSGNIHKSALGPAS